MLFNRKQNLHNDYVFRLQKLLLNHPQMETVVIPVCVDSLLLLSLQKGNERTTRFKQVCR